MKPFTRNKVLYANIFEIILYQESENIEFGRVFNLLTCKFPACSWFYIFHDKDTLEDGTLKKPHYHLIITFSRERSINSISQTLGVPVNYIKVKENLRGSVQYLIHMNHENKYQYDPKDITSNTNVDIYLQDNVKIEDNNIDILFDFIDKFYAHISLIDVQDFARRNNIWGTYRINRQDCIARLETKKNAISENFRINNF